MKGAATDNRGAVIPNAVVTFASSEKVLSAKTSEAGDYSIQLKNGEYRVSVDASHLKFQPLRRSNINVYSGSTRTLNFELSGLLPVALEYKPKRSQSLDDTAISYLPYNYEEIPQLSRSGVKNGLVSFGIKRETAWSVTYNVELFLLSPESKVTFKYDFYTVVADRLSYDKRDRSLLVSGNVTVTNGQNKEMFAGDVKIKIDNS